MNVLVIGGTRGVGHAVVVAAHAAGHTMTVMARTAAGFDGPVSGIRMVAGDAEDAADIDRAIAGQQAVVWTVGVAGNGSGASSNGGNNGSGSGEIKVDPNQIL